MQERQRRVLAVFLVAVAAGLGAAAGSRFASGGVTAAGLVCLGVDLLLVVIAAALMRRST
jgi:hypothetical protein